MGTTILVSALTYMLLRSIEALSKIMWKWHRDWKDDERKLEQEDERRNSK